MFDFKKKMNEMMLHEYNRKIDDFNEISEYLTQYSHAVSYVIPLKYKQTIINYLDSMKEEQSLLYEIEENKELGLITFLIYNFGVMYRENLLKEMKRKEY